MGGGEQGTGARKGRGESAIRKASQKMRNSGAKRDGEMAGRASARSLANSYAPSPAPLPRSSPAPKCTSTRPIRERWRFVRLLCVWCGALRAKGGRGATDESKNIFT